jgi:hypothetical protein
LPPIPCSFSALVGAIPSFLVHRGYNYIRLINATGQEVSAGAYNRTSRTASILPKAQLLNLAAYPQWQSLNGKSVGEAAVSQIDDITQGVAQTGVAIPSFFLSVNVRNSLGQVAASVTIDYNIDSLLSFLQSSGVMLVNTDGYFLAGAPDGYSNMGFAYPPSDSRSSYTFQSLWSSEWGTMMARMRANTNSSYNFTMSKADSLLTDVKSMGDIYSFTTSHGLFVYSDICWSFLIGVCCLQSSYLIYSILIR